MTTVVIQIGNSDDKLSQERWSKLITHLKQVVQQDIRQIHFSGGSPAEAPWQNYCLVGELLTDVKTLKARLRELCRTYGQDSIALIYGATDFVRAV